MGNVYRWLVLQNIDIDVIDQVVTIHVFAGNDWYLLMYPGEKYKKYYK